MVDPNFRVFILKAGNSEMALSIITLLKCQNPFNSTNWVIYEPLIYLLPVRHFQA